MAVESASLFDEIVFGNRRLQPLVLRHDLNDVCVVASLIEFFF